jgi:hypothetical protein
MDPDHAQTRRYCVGTEPAERQLIGCDQHDQDIRGAMPVADNIGMGNGEIERGMCHLCDLCPRRQIGAGDQVEARNRTLAVRHVGHFTGKNR